MSVMNYENQFPENVKCDTNNNDNLMKRLKILK